MAALTPDMDFAFENGLIPSFGETDRKTPETQDPENIRNYVMGGMISAMEENVIGISAVVRPLRTQSSVNTEIKPDLRIVE